MAFFDNEKNNVDIDLFQKKIIIIIIAVKDIFID
jgi:hypothetical protein